MFKNIAGFITFAIMVNVIFGMYFFADEPSALGKEIEEIQIEISLPEQPAPKKKYSEEDVLCLAKNIYHEARGQDIDGQYAVGFVTMNRVNHADFPNSVCEVVYEPYQFSWTHQGMRLDLSNKIDREAWENIVEVSIEILEETAYNNLYGVTHYHAVSVNPNWGYQLVMQIDDHVFYKRL